MYVSKVGINVNKVRASPAGLGDSICCTPTLRKLANSYNSYIEVYSRFPDVYKNLPYVSESKFIEEKKDYHFTVYSWGTHKERGERLTHHFVDIRQFPALQCGFQLLPEEMHCDYVPTESFCIDVPNEYVIVHAPISWPVKTWNADKWQELCNNINLPIVSIGKTVDQGEWSYKCNRLNNVIDFIDQTSLDQVWHLCNNAKYVITTDSSILHLASTTDTEIIYIAMGRHPFLTSPYRNGSQEYKMKIVSNNCNWCMSNLTMINQYFSEKAAKSGEGLDIRNCYINDNNNEFCQPSVDQVLEAING